MNTTPTVSSGLSFVTLMMDAGWVAKLILLLLLFASILSWAIIFTKWKLLKRASRENQIFLHSFWQSKNVEDIYEKFEQNTHSPAAMIFKAGYKELRRVPPGSGAAAHASAVENMARSLNRSTSLEIATLERNLSWLATTASAAPFVGLFGTVWGIMTSFQNIGATGGANLAVVAPGIAEALIATAAGIGAAIPAVVGYNHFLSQIKRIAVDLDAFTQDFLNLAQRSPTKE